jgi:hypothetical protein
MGAHRHHVNFSSARGVLVTVMSFIVSEAKHR